MVLLPRPTPEEPTANVALRDAMVRHQIQIQRFSQGIITKVHALLNDTEEDLALMIRVRLATSQGLDTPADVRRLNTLLTMVENLRTTTWDKADELWKNELEALAATEPGFLAHQLDTTSPVVLDLALPAISQLKALVSKSPFEGATLKEWGDSLEREDLRRIESQIRIGMMAGEDSATIARRIVGTARLKGLDGMTEITRRNAASITQTAVNFIANQARRQFVLQNKELFNEEVYHATLDSRTTARCRALDGKRFPVGTGPVPPLHFRCRSTRVPALGTELIGNRPMKNSTEKGLLREWAADNGLDKVPTSRDDLQHGTKGAFDTWARKRVRELTGTTPAETSYQDWLSTQSKAFQEDILGKTKAALFRDGNLTLDKFVTGAGDELTLAQLAVKQAEAFRAAGLDPGDFKL